MRVNSTNNIQVRNQQNFGMVEYRGAKKASTVKNAIVRRFGKAASDALGVLEQNHGQNQFSKIIIRFDKKAVILECRAELRSPTTDSTAYVRGSTRRAINKEGALNLLYGTSEMMSRLTSKLEKSIDGLRREGSLEILPEPLVVGNHANEAQIPDWQGVTTFG